MINFYLRLEVLPRQMGLPRKYYTVLRSMPPLEFFGVNCNCVDSVNQVTSKH